MSNQPPTPPGDAGKGSEDWPSAPGGGPPPSAPGSEPPPAAPGSEPPPSAPGGSTPPPSAPGGSQPPASPPPASPPPASPTPGGATPGGAPPPSGAGLNVGDAFNYGWQAFQRNMGPILTGTLIYLGISLVVGIIWFFITSAIVGFGGDSGAGFVALMVSTAVMSLVVVALFFLVQAGIVRAALAITRGQQISMQTLLSTDNLGQVVLTAVIVGVAAAIGFALCYIPGLVVMVFTSFAMHFVIDRRMGAMDAIRASVDLVNRNLGTMVLLLVAGYIANAIGSALCGIGLLVSIPVVILANTYAYRRMQGEAVA